MVYFANGNTFRPSYWETNPRMLDYITGVLVTCTQRTDSEVWYVAELIDDGERTFVYFDSEIDTSDYERLLSFTGKAIKLYCIGGKPLISLIGTDAEGIIRANLLRGVAEGQISKEDLPALFDFYRGNYDRFPKWTIFKKQLNNEELIKVEEDLNRQNENLKKDIEAKEKENNQLYEFLEEIEKHKKEFLRQIEGCLLLLQGEEYIEGNQYLTSFGPTPDNIITIGSGYKRLKEAIEKFRIMKGVYAIVDDKILKVHHVFLEPKGRAFLLGSSTTILRTKPDKLKELIGDIHRAVYGY